MSIQKKHLITGAIAIVTISGAYLYWQYTKLMESAVKFKGLKLNNISLTKVSLELFLNVWNSSKLAFVVSEQRYNVYMDNIKLTTITKPTAQKIEANSASPVSLTVDFNPSKIGQEVKATGANTLMNIMGAIIKVEVKLKIQVLKFIKISVPYTYTTTLGQLMSSKPAT